MIKVTIVRQYFWFRLSTGTRLTSDQVSCLIKNFDIQCSWKTHYIGNSRGAIYQFMEFAIYNIQPYMRGLQYPALHAGLS